MRLYAVGVRLVAHVFRNRVIDRLMVERHSRIGGCIIGVDLSVRRGVVGNEALQRRLVGFGNHLGIDLARLAVLRAHNRNLPDRTPTSSGQFLALALAVAHVAPLAAHVGFINLNRPRERDQGVLVVRPSLADALRQITSRLLRHFQIAAQLHGRNRLEVGRKLVDRDKPDLEAQLGALRQRSGLHGEILAAVAAAIGLRLARLDVERPALWAAHALGPSLLDKPLFGGLVVREHLEQLDEREALAEGFAGCFLCHVRIS